MALKRHLWYNDLVLATMERSDELIIGFVMASFPYMQNFRSLELPIALKRHLWYTNLILITLEGSYLLFLCSFRPPGANF